MAAAEKGKKKRAPLSSFTILLIILVVLAIVTVIMSASGVEGVQGATLSQVLTAPVFGFQDAIGVCLFVMILGGFLGIVTETGALDAGIAALVHKLKGNELVLIPIFWVCKTSGWKLVNLWLVAVESKSTHPTIFLTAGAAIIQPLI